MNFKLETKENQVNNRKTITLSNYVRSSLQSKEQPNTGGAQLQQLEQYKIENIIGQGSFAQVRVCRSKENGQRLAIKIYTKCKLDQQGIANVKREIQILNIVDHQNIIKMRDHFEDDKSVYILCDYVSSLSLADFRKNRQLTEVQVRTIFRQLMDSINYLHHLKIAHRDIKLENILYGQQITLIDFGFAIQSDKYCTVSCGTGNYMAPELIAKTPYKPQAADIWACGIVLYILLTGEFTYKPSKIIAASPGLVKILKGCLESNTDKRWTSEKVLAELEQLI